MAWWDPLISAVQSFFSPKPQVQSAWPIAPKPVYQSTPTPSYTQQVSRSYPSVAPKPSVQSRGVAVQGPTYTAPSRGGSGTSPSPAITQTPTPTPAPSSKPIPSSALQNVVKSITSSVSPLAQEISPVIGKAGKALTTVGTALNAPQIIPGGLGAAAQGWAGFQQQVEQARKQGWLPDIPAFMSGVSRFGPATNSDTLNQIWNFVQGLRGGGSYIQTPNLWQTLPQGPTTPTGAPTTLPGATQGGQTLPSAARIGAPQSATRGIVPSPVTTPRTGIVPSPTGTPLPANFAGLNRGNVNPALAQAIPAEAIQSIGQLLLQSLLGNQSSLTGITPGLAQALWGAPTASMPFGGYDASAAVPDQSRIKQPANLPPTPQGVAMG